MTAANSPGWFLRTPGPTCSERKILLSFRMGSKKAARGQKKGALSKSFKKARKHLKPVDTTLLYRTSNLRKIQVYMSFENRSQWIPKHLRFAGLSPNRSKNQGPNPTKSILFIFFEKKNEANKTKRTKKNLGKTYPFKKRKTSKFGPQVPALAACAARILGHQCFREAFT